MFTFPVSEVPPKCQMTGGGFPRIGRFSIKVCGELKVTCRTILHSSGCFSCGETLCALPCLWGGLSFPSYLPALTCTWAAEQDLCAPLWKGAQCVLDPVQGCDASAKLTSVILPFNTCAHRNLSFGSTFYFRVGNFFR